MVGAFDRAPAGGDIIDRACVGGAFIGGSPVGGDCAGDGLPVRGRQFRAPGTGVPVVVFTAGQGADAEAVAELDAFDGADRDDGLREAGVQLVENGVADAGRQSGHEAFDAAAGGVLIADAFLQPGLRPGVGLGVRHGERTQQAALSDGLQE